MSKRSNCWAVLLSGLLVLHSQEAHAFLVVKAHVARGQGPVVPAVSLPVVLKPDQGLYLLDDYLETGRMLGLKLPKLDAYVTRQFLYDGRLVQETWDAQAVRLAHPEFFRRVETEASRRDRRTPMTATTDRLGHAIFYPAHGQWIVSATQRNGETTQTWSRPVHVTPRTPSVSLYVRQAVLGLSPSGPPSGRETVYRVTPKGRAYAAQARPLLARLKQQQREEWHAAWNGPKGSRLYTSLPWVVSTYAMFYGGLLGVLGGLGLTVVSAALSADPSTATGVRLTVASAGLLGGSWLMAQPTNAALDEHTRAAREVDQRYLFLQDVNEDSDDMTLIEAIAENPELRDRLNRAATGH